MTRVTGMLSVCDGGADRLCISSLRGRIRKWWRGSKHPWRPVQKCPSHNHHHRHQHQHRNTHMTLSRKKKFLSFEDININRILKHQDKNTLNPKMSGSIIFITILNTNIDMNNININITITYINSIIYPLQKCPPFCMCANRIFLRKKIGLKNMLRREQEVPPPNRLHSPQIVYIITELLPYFLCL